MIKKIKPDDSIGGLKTMNKLNEMIEAINELLLLHVTERVKISKVHKGKTLIEQAEEKIPATFVQNLDKS